MKARPYIISETNWHHVKQTEYSVAILPWGATEAHNFHLAYGTDSYQCDYIAAESASIAWDKGVKVAVLPTIPFGVQTTQMDIPFCINMNPSTQMLVLSDIVHSLEQQGVKKLLILNGHGGNNFRQMIREIQVDSDVFLCTLNWYNVLNPNGYFDEPGDHAGELETSVMMYIQPELVAPLMQAGNGKENKFRISAFREGWAWAPRIWTEATNDTGVGNPAKSSAHKGEKFANAVISKIAEFLVELDATPVDKMYQK
jgi:creatinine amidohydrolase